VSVRRRAKQRIAEVRRRQWAGWVADAQGPAIHVTGDHEPSDQAVAALLEVRDAVIAAWRGAPYFAAFKKLAAERVITIRIGTKVIVVLPDREIDLGHVGPDESVRLEPGPDGRIAALKVPRAQA